MGKRKKTRSILSILMILLFAAQPLLAEAKKENLKPDPLAKIDLKDLNNVDSLTNWMTYYYLRPQPEMLVPALLLSDKLGLLQGDSSAPLQAFASRVFAQNPEKVKDWFTQLAGMSDTGKTIVLTSIWWSNSKEAKELLAAISEQLPEKARAEFRKQIDSQPPEIDKMDIESPDVLDMLWGCFSATGDEKYVKRLIDTLAWGKSDNKNLPKMLIASAARWSLASNIEQHERVKEICESVQKQNPEVKPYLDKLFEDLKAQALKKKEEGKQTEKKKSALQDKGQS